MPKTKKKKTKHHSKHVVFHKKAARKIRKKRAHRLVKHARKPRVRLPKAVFPEEQMEKLIQKGRSRDFITETEILYAMPELEEYIEEYEALLDKFDDYGIEVVTTETSFLGAPQKDEILKERSLPIKEDLIWPTSLPILSRCI